MNGLANCVEMKTMSFQVKLYHFNKQTKNPNINLLLHSKLLHNYLIYKRNKKHLHLVQLSRASAYFSEVAPSFLCFQKRSQVCMIC